MRIAITGGIGSGKSYVCQWLRERGIEVYDCDREAKRLMNTSATLISSLTKLIGKETYVNGTLNKARVAQFLLESEDHKQAINRIVHPAVIKDFYDSGLTWMESAILFEAHLEHTVDYIVCVTAPEEVRIQRIMLRDGISRERALEWIRAQIPQDYVATHSHFTINNDGKADISKQIDSILNNLNHIK